MSSSFRNSLVRAAVAAALAGSAIGTAHAQQWVFDPRVEVGAVYDDNYRLSDQPGQEIEFSGGSIDAELGMSMQTPATLFGITPRIHSTFFPDASSEEATDYYLSGIAQKKTQRLETKLEASFADESVVSSELLAADFPGLGLGQTVSGDTGRVSFRNRRRLILADPSLAWDWTERRHLTADFQYVDVKFDDTFFEQVGYKSYMPTVGMLFNTTQRSTVWVTVFDQKFSPDDNTPDTNTVGAAVEYRTSRTEIASFYFRIGANHSERDAQGADAKVSTDSFNGGIGAEWQLQTTRIVFDALRSTSPSSAGAVVNRDELRFRATRTFDPRFSAYVAARGIQTKGLENDFNAVRDRKYATGQLGFEWRANRQWAVHGAYEYTWQEYELEPDDAVSNGVTLSVVYQPRRLDK